jgi:mannosyltransferase
MATATIAAVSNDTGPELIGDDEAWGPGRPGGRGRSRRRHWAARATRWQDATTRWGQWRHFDRLLVILLMALSLALRWRTLWASYWGDEAIAIGIAVHPISALPRYLVNDGSPPLYYVMLHYWLGLFGRSEPATHALSMIPGLLAIPASWWSGNRLFGRWAGRGAAALVATCAYLDYYSTETRMYSWLVLTSILALTCFVLAYREAGRRYWVAATVLMSTVLYFQYYGLYLLSATVLVGIVAALPSRSWPQVRSTLLYGAVCGAAFAPWAPQFLYQLQNTGAPWAPHPAVLDLFGDSFNALASAGWAGILVAIGVALLAWRGSGAWRAPAQAGGSAVALINPPAPARKAPSALALATAIPLLTLVLAWGAGQVVNSWNPRYLGIAVVPAMLALAGGLARARKGLAALVVAVVALIGTAVPTLVDRTVTVETSKSDVAFLLGELRGQLKPGALVISAEVTDTPVVALDLGKGYRYATPFGRLSDPLVVNWSDLPTRLQGINPQTQLDKVLATVPVGGQVLLVNPTSWGGSETPERYRGPVKADGIAANQAVLTDPELLAKVTLPVPPGSDPLYPMTAVLFVKLRTVPGH